MRPALGGAVAVAEAHVVEEPAPDVWVRCFGCRVQGSGFRVWFRVQGAGCKVQGLGFRVQGLGFRVESYRGGGGWSRTKLMGKKKWTNTSSDIMDLPGKATDGMGAYMG